MSYYYLRTSDFQLAADGDLAVVVLGSAGVNAPVEAHGLSDLEGTDALHTDLTEFGVLADDHLVFQPLDLGLPRREKKC